MNENENMRLNAIALAISAACSQLVAVPASAQSPGNAEVYPPGYTPPRRANTTPAERAKAKLKRRQEGSIAAQTKTTGEGNPIPEAKTRTSREDRATARAERLTQTERENRAGQITSKGETGDLGSAVVQR